MPINRALYTRVTWPQGMPATNSASRARARACPQARRFGKSGARIIELACRPQFSSRAAD
ncbi:hypothetical protein GBAR_LOCUS14731 [Geodia barretti]|uniref:Uncharacterized protein n=1 Tax=Geodia barretti TaxID=519541 RepID=A0AA35SBH6_GEOBA|nr:hypothetical protein GBAR_LOCUS14731 [Geodia barretti]